MTALLVERALAKVNLTLRVGARRGDGLHEIESLVVFAQQVADGLTLETGRSLGLDVRGSNRKACGPVSDNLVLKAARALAERAHGLSLGHFILIKRIPVAGGVGGGSATAAAALRLLARANDLALDDLRLLDAASASGADVPVCLDPHARVMRGIGEVLSEPIELPKLAAVLVNPGVALATKDVFAAFDALQGTAKSSLPLRGGLATPDLIGGSRGGVVFEKQSRLQPPPGRLRRPPSPDGGGIEEEIPRQHEALVAYLAQKPNDLEPAAISLAPVIAEVLAALRQLPECRLARMSGSGATCFMLCDSTGAATAAAQALQPAHPGWWVRATALGGGPA